MTPTVLIVSPQFPPSTLAGVHRARHLAKHLPAHGWRPVVIRVDERFYAETPDPALAGLVPASVQQIRTGAVPAPLARLVRIGDIGLRAYLPLARAIDHAIERERPSAVLLTGAPFYPMLIAGRIRRRRDIPVVLDFQDPWVSAHGAGLTGFSKAALSHRLAVALEPRALRHADFVTSVSEGHNADMRMRYPWLRPEAMAAIPIGGDPEDYEALRSHRPDPPRVVLDPSCINLSYVGAFLPHAAAVVRALFCACSRLLQSEPRLAGRLRLTFVGTSNQPDGRVDRVLPIAAQEGVSHMVSEFPGRVAFLEALGILAASHGLLLIGSDEPHYTASKIYPALMSGRPYLSVFHAQSSAHAILSAAGGGRAISFAGAEDLDGLVDRLADALRTLALDSSSFGPVDPAAYADYTAHAVSGRFAKVFQQVARPAGASP